MRTTANINSIYHERLKAASEILGISMHDLISVLLTRLTQDPVFEVKPYETVKYQKSNPDISWITMHIKFKPVFYEKAQDLKRNFKYSVSWLISFAIVNYLDDIMDEMTFSENREKKVANYDQNYIYIAKMYGEIPVFINIWGVPEKKYLNRVLE